MRLWVKQDFGVPDIVAVSHATPPLTTNSENIKFILAQGWVTEGESAFGEMSGSAPKSVHQQALRGIAKVLLEVCPIHG